MQEFLDLVQPDSVHHEGQYSSYHFNESGFSYIEVVSYDNRLVSARSMTDMGPAVVYFDADPRTRTKRALDAKLLHLEYENIDE